MGDRANVALVPEEGQVGTVYLYTHWGGTKLPLVVQKALGKRWRWNDKAYLTRIIFCEMVGDAWGDETGFGIDVSPPDNGHPYVVVDVATQEVRFVAESPTEQLDNVLHRWSFTEYVNATDKVLKEAYRG